MSHIVPLFLIFSSKSHICNELMDLLEYHRVEYSPLCIDSAVARSKCKSWGVSVIPTIIDVSRGHAEFCEGFWACKDLVTYLSRRPSVPAPVVRKRPRYIMAKPDPFDIVSDAAPHRNETAAPHRDEVSAKKSNTTPDPVSKQGASSVAPHQYSGHPDPRPDSDEVGHIDPEQDFLDLSVSHEKESVSSLSDLLNTKPKEDEEILTKIEDINDPHEKQKLKLDSFHKKKRVNAEKLEKKAKRINEENLKEDLLAKAKRMQKNRDVDDTARQRSQPKVPDTAIDTLNLSRP